MPGINRIRSLIAIITSRCNLDCTYCYQDAKKDQTMPWKILKRSLDLVLASRQEEVDMIFMGGEPVIEMPLIRRAVDYLRDKDRPGAKVGLGIGTNGTLLTDESIMFLVENGFDIHLSFDGVPEAQDLRGENTFETLDRLLDHLLEKHPGHCRDNLTVVYTLTPSNVKYLGDSVGYFIDKRVPRISINSCITGDASWDSGRIVELEAQYTRILADSVRYMEREGKIPLLLFRNKYDDSTCPREKDHMCGIALGETLTVDSDGITYGCTTLAQSYQNAGEGSLAGRLGSMCMGHIESSDLEERLIGFTALARSSGLFFEKKGKYSSYRRCRDCEHIDRCTICPVSIAAVPGNDDPDRVPDFNCACNMVALEHRDRFPGRKDPRKVLGPHVEYEEDMKRWRDLAGSSG